MKIKELIHELGKYDKEMTVVVSGYEDGYEHFHIETETLLHKPDNPYWSGEFQQSEEAETRKFLCVKRNLRL